jgi:hypothetical protein
VSCCRQRCFGWLALNLNVGCATSWVVDLVAAAVVDSCSCIGSAKCCGRVASCV